MANRDNDDDRNGHKNQKFNIDSKAFESEDDFDFDFESEDHEVLFLSQKKSRKRWVAKYNTPCFWDFYC